MKDNLSYYFAKHPQLFISALIDIKLSMLRLVLLVILTGRHA